MKPLISVPPVDRDVDPASARGLQRRRLVLQLARNVAGHRQKAGLTQHQLAEAAELSRATIHLIEAGACDPRLSTVTSLADALGVKAMSLFEGGASV